MQKIVKNNQASDPAIYKGCIRHKIKAQFVSRHTSFYQELPPGHSNHPLMQHPQYWLR